MRRRRQHRRTLAARGAAGVLYVAAVVWLASPTWRPPSPQTPPAGVERRAAAPRPIAVVSLSVTTGLPLGLPVEQVGTSESSGSTDSSAGSTDASTGSGGTASQPSSDASGGTTSTPAEPSPKRLVGFEG